MIINKEGKLVANVAQPTVIFENEADYTAWLATLPDPDCQKNFIIIKTYDLAPGGVYEVSTMAELNALTGNQRMRETLYIVDENNSGWRWEGDETSGTWVQLFGNGFGQPYVITVDTYADLATAEKAENIVYIVKDENAMYHYVEGATPGTGTFEKASGAAAEGIVPYDPTDLDPDVIPADTAVYVPELDGFFKHGEGEDIFHTVIEEHIVYTERPTETTEPSISAGDMYYDEDGEGNQVIKIVTDPTDDTGASDYVMDPEEVKTGIFFDPIKNLLDVISLLDEEGLIKLDVDAAGGIYVPYKFSNENSVACHAVKRMNSHGGDTGFYLSSISDFPPITNMSDAELAATYIDVDTNKGYQITGLTPQYVERGIGEQEQEVITVQSTDYLPSTPSKGVIYIIEKSVDGTKLAGQVKIANPMADFTQPASETNRYYLDVGTDITALIARIEALEHVADDVIIKETFSQFPLPSADTTDKLYIELEYKKCYVTKVNLGGDYEWVLVGGQDLAAMMPSMALSTWMAMDPNERPDYCNIVPEDGAATAVFDGFGFTFTTPTP